MKTLAITTTLLLAICACTSSKQKTFREVYVDKDDNAYILYKDGTGMLLLPNEREAPTFVWRITNDTLFVDYDKEYNFIPSEKIPL